ncbi:hypothetical protein Ddc_12434 [Ditylenchus destructor]|nr:hypothetical protein Ddc_12434 [Ditylenchus destructor]
MRHVTSKHCFCSANLLILLATRCFCQDITDIPWPKVHINKNGDYTDIGCYMELRPESMHHKLRLRSPSADSPCMIRMPGNVEVMYKSNFNNPETYVRFMMGNSMHQPTSSTVKIFHPSLDHKSPENSGIVLLLF